GDVLNVEQETHPGAGAASEANSGIDRDVMALRQSPRRKGRRDTILLGQRIDLRAIGRRIGFGRRCRERRERGNGRREVGRRRILARYRRPTCSTTAATPTTSATASWSAVTAG